MKPRVSVVIPALEDQELLAAHLPPLIAELDARGADDELTIVDDSGADVLSDWVREHFPGRARVIVRERNGGFGPALLSGARLGTADHLLALNPDVKVRPGFLEPLVQALADPQVAAVSPRVLLHGDPAQPESHQALGVRDGRLRVLPRRPGDERAPRPIPFPIGGAMLVRRAEFVDDGGFDPLLAPFYFEDVDLGLTHWRRGRRVLEVPASVVEHHHRGTIGRVVPEDLVLAAVEKNRLLVQWKHVDTRADAHEHLCALWRDALDAGLAGRREELLWMALALEEIDAATDARAHVGPTQRTLAHVFEASDPTGA